MSSIKKSSIPELAAEIKYANKKNLNRAIVLIGAGCSTPEVPLCAEIEALLLKEFGDILKFCPTQSYYAYMANLSVEKRDDFFNNILKINDAKINSAHLYLASLMVKGYFDSVLTTNFDPLVVKAVGALNKFPAVYDVPSITKFIPGSFKFPSVIYLHGQGSGFFQMHDEGQMKEISHVIGDILNDVAVHRPIIVVGYSGNDPMFDALDQVKRYNNNLYWVQYKDKSPEAHVCEWMEKRKGEVHLIEGYDAANFFWELHKSVNTETPDIIDNPFQHLKTSIALFSPKTTLGNNQIDIFSGTHERIDRAIIDEKTNVNLSTKVKEAVLEGQFEKLDELKRLVLIKGTEEDKTYLSSAFYNKGIQEFKNGNLDLAISDYTEAINLAHDDFEAYVNRGIVYHSIKEFDFALNDYSKAIDINPTIAEPYINRGRVYQEMGEHNLAISDLKKALIINPKSAIAYNNLGISYSKNGDFDIGIENFDNAIKLDPNYANAYNNRAISYYKKEQYDIAIFDYTIAIELSPNHFDYYTNRGMAYFALRKYDLAIADYSKAIKLKPDYSKAYNKRAVAYYWAGKKNEAMKDARKALQIDHTSNLPEEIISLLK